MVRFFSLLLVVLQVLFTGVGRGAYDPPEKEIEPQPAVVNDIDGDSGLSDSVKFAAEARNAVQAVYTSDKKDEYMVTNSDAAFIHDLEDEKLMTVTDKDGGVYAADTFDAFYIGADGKKHYASDSYADAYMNTTKYGLYYYDTKIRGLTFAEKKRQTPEFVVDKAYHVYADRAYEQLSLLAVEATQGLAAFGSEIAVPAANVNKISIADKNGVHDSVASIDAASVEYIAFDIDGVGIFAVIVPKNSCTDRTEITLSAGKYTITTYADYKAGTGINKYDETGGYDLNRVELGMRIYTDKTHSFDGVAKEAYFETHPLQSVRVTSGNASARSLGYDGLTGSYTVFFDNGGRDFTYQYNNPDLKISAGLKIDCDDRDRSFYLRTESINGCLECAAVLDENERPAPIMVEVCKNFYGDFGEPEPLYYTARDKAYGVAVFPLSVRADSQTELTVLHLFQNWGKYPLKQLSSIKYGDPYYHLSTGVTETNCIAQYGLGASGWILPDFRCRSGNMWLEQPQFNSCCKLGFARYNKNVLFIKADNSRMIYNGSRIDSVGQTYADITTSYTSDCGSYDYTLRHFEYPQTDENRTYYTVDITFNRDMTFTDFRRDFEIFWFNGRYAEFTKLGYLNKDNECVTGKIENSPINKYYTLGSDCPYIGFFDITEKTINTPDEHFNANIAVVVRNSSMIIGGEQTDIPLCFKDSSAFHESNGALTLDKKSLKIKAGDRIRLDLILLPWGVGNEEHDENVRRVREDSAVNTIKVTAQTGSVIADSILPRVRAEGNRAEFTVTGGRNNIAVRVDGFTTPDCPAVYMDSGSGYSRLDLASQSGFDGYTVFYNDDGTYGYSFVFESDNTSTYSFKLEG